MRVESSPAARLGRSAIACTCLCLGVSGTSLAAGGGGGAPKGPSPVTVDNERSEQDLTFVRLVPRAVERLGIRTVGVERRPVAEVLSSVGFVMTPPGRTLQIVSPGEGTVLGIGRDELPHPGTRVAKGEALLQLLMVSQAEAAAAREIVEVAAARLAVAEAELKLRGAAAQEEVDSARSSLAAARRRQGLLISGAGGTPDRLAPVTVRAPFSGVIQSLTASTGQSVSAGVPLLSLVQTDPIWVRTPLFSGDLSRLDPRADARVRRLAGREWHVASAITGPPTADAAISSVDLYFELPNPAADLRPGERVEVSLTLASDGPAIVLPYSAVLYDIHGGSWVYEQIDSGVYVRRRLKIDFIVDGEAVARGGPADGVQIVIEGAAELFGAEFGIGR